MLLRLAVLLHRGRSPQPLPDVQLRAKGRSLELEFPAALDEGSSADPRGPGTGDRLPEAEAGFRLRVFS